MIEYRKIEIGEEILQFLRNKDERIKRLIDQVGGIEREYIPNPFVALVNSIIFQQLAYKAANTIWNRFEVLIQDVTPENVLSASFDSLRECGLSKSKISYIKNIAEAVINRDLALERINKETNEEIISQLIRIKGIGEWTAEMFLIFSLNRKNVLSYKDLGIRKGLKWLYNLNNEPTKEDFQRFKEKFSPFNTIVSFYLWEITIRNYFEYESVFTIPELTRR